MPTWVKPWMCLSALGVGIFLSVRPIFVMLESVIIHGISSAGATLVAAVLGFTAVTLQTRVGFQNLTKSQENQSLLDRNAREHQAEIGRQTQAEEANRERKTLAGALTGELSAAYSRMANGRQILYLNKIVYEQFGSTIPPRPVKVAENVPTLDPQIFKANVARLGILGPSTASDVVEIYQMLLWDRNVGSVDALSGDTIAKVFDAQIQAIDSWLKDNVHVQNRLLSAFGGVEDPGPLIFERQKRDEARASKEA